jgi:alkylation response protein AidB-like acyl-CoA dehydrogenase
MRFLMFDVFQAGKLFAGMLDTKEVTAELLNAILEEAAKLTEELIAPLNQSGDQNGCTLENGKVTTPPGFKQAYKAFSDGGWGGLAGNPDFGGQGMPKMLSVLVEEMLMGSNPSFGLYPILTSGASMSLNLHGSDALKAMYLPRLYQGTWSATMCLTEPHAGTDLGIIKTRAAPLGDGAFRITGTKMFITAGDHDLSENIVHFVLAKLPDAPEGSQGISMFLIPKYQVSETGDLGQSNGVSCGSIEHKMGLKASATCVMNFDNAVGYLVGEENRGMACMFTMMNYERLTMGLQGIGLAENSYQVASRYAQERMQGRAAEGAHSPDKPADPIIVHPDVRRMLLTMRANILAGRAMSLYLASKLDTLKFHSSKEEQQRASDLVELLTPVAKAYCTDRGFDACVLGQQVLGGHGYISEWGQEQLVRDARIAQIYEGANGIQALDLMGRKTVHCKGRLLEVLLQEINDFCGAHKSLETASACLDVLANSCNALQKTTQEIIRRAERYPAEIGAASYPYMELLGLIMYCYMWSQILVKTGDKEVQVRLDKQYLIALQSTGKFFLDKVMPRYKSLLEELDAGAAAIMAMKAEQF